MEGERIQQILSNFMTKNGQTLESGISKDQRTRMKEKKGRKKE